MHTTNQLCRQIFGVVGRENETEKWKREKEKKGKEKEEEKGKEKISYWNRARALGKGRNPLFKYALLAKSP